jgi:putative copper resistance protein D
MSELSAAVRFLNLAASVLLAGGFAFALLVARPAYLGVASAGEADFSRFLPPSWRVAAWCVVAVFASAVLGFWFQLLYVSHSEGVSAAADTALTLLIQTQFGRVWMLRMGLLVALAALIAWGRRADRGGDAAFLTAGFVLSALLLGAAALSGHASAGEGASLAVGVSADMLHLLTCALWLGGLWPFTAMLRACRRDGGVPATSVADAAARRFSALALVSVPVLLATGGYNAWNFVNGFAPLFGTPYGKLLLAKIGVMLPMLGFGAMNFLALRSSDPGPARLDRIARNAVLETVLGVTILLIVGHMSLQPPARHVQPDWPFPFRWDWDAAAFTDAYPTTYKRPAVPYQAISVANGKRLYEASGCAACHGTDGYGDGPLAKELRPRPADLTAPHASMHTAGDLYWWISRGIGESAMPGFEQKLSDEERWDLVNFLRALSGSDRARILEPAVQGEPWLVAPDFTYQTVTGSTRTLRDYRGRRLVLLALLVPDDTEERVAQLTAAHTRLKTAGVEIIVVPGANGARLMGNPPAFVVAEGNAEILESYALLARSFNDNGLLAAPPHAEFLIDKQGYIRARWLPAEGPAWDELGNLLAQAERLNREKPSAPAPEEHVH